ncbi:MAG TPA: hypothetical protein VFT91_09325 [Dehalococcoidia bacterium]|nr:hypothetical protein [Dehalococcoidia bacterium]
MEEPPASRFARDFDQAWQWFVQDPLLMAAALPSGGRPYLVWLARLPLTDGIRRLRRLLGDRRWLLPDDWLHMTVRELGFVEPDAAHPPPAPPQRTVRLGPPNVLRDSVVLEVRGSGLDGPFRLPHASILYSDATRLDPELRDVLAAARAAWRSEGVSLEAMELVAVDTGRPFGPWTVLARQSLDA